MEFALRGFTPETGFRVFAFDGVAGDQRQTGFTVRTDLALARKYGISLQDLPIICRGLLEKREAGEERTLTFTEDQMRALAGVREAEQTAARNKRASRRTSFTRPPRSGAFVGSDSSPRTIPASSEASMHAGWQKAEA